MFAFKKIYLLSEIISCSRIINQKIDTLILCTLFEVKNLLIFDSNEKTRKNYFFVDTKRS